MKKVYPVIITPAGNGVTVYIPDFDIYTQGDDLAEAIVMAGDAVGLMGIDMQDDGKELPAPSNTKDLQVADGDMVTLIDVDFAKYRRTRGSL